jgi:hypothetical protein
MPSLLNKEALRFAARAANSDFFGTIGKPVAHQDVLPVAHWQQCANLMSGRNFQEYLLEAQNSLAGAVVRKNRTAFESWNELLDGIDTIVVPRLSEKDGASYPCQPGTTQTRRKLYHWYA